MNSEKLVMFRVWYVLYVNPGIIYIYIIYTYIYIVYNQPYGYGSKRMRIPQLLRKIP